MRAHVPNPLVAALLLPAALAIGVAGAYGDTSYVCWDGSGDYVTIQEGIDAASDGDEVVVCDGVYTGPSNKNLDFHAKAITVRSENGPDNCIIDCEGDGRGFHFHSWETNASVVEGLTMRNGYVAAGGGICCEGSAPTIVNCTITQNTATNGGGVYSFEWAEGAVMLVNCTITENTADSGCGGGVICGYCDLRIVNCTIARNTADGWGGGVCIAVADATIAGSILSENTAGAAGGGLWWNAFSPTSVTNCAITGNTTQAIGSVGGAIYTEWGGHVTNCKIAGNWADPHGQDGTGGGGAVFCEVGALTITNCTIVGNMVGMSPTCGEAVYGDDLTIANCVLWNDNLLHEIYGSGDVTYNDVQGGWAGEGNIDADPLFVAGPLGDHYLSQTAAGQPVDSPCVNAGSDTAENLGLDTRTTRTDQVGDAGIVDMGYHYPIVCVGDLDGDNDTDQADLGILLADWSCDDPVNGCVGDLNGDDRTDQADLGILLGDWGCTN